MKSLWLRKEDKAGELRVPVTPKEVKALTQAGVAVTVERSEGRCFSDADYAAAGATLTSAPWSAAPLESVVIALKELAESDAPIAHTHIHFSHTFKGQEGAAGVLSRYARGGGVVYDLEFLHDAQGKRIAAFGYWAGFVGAALGLLGLAHFYNKRAAASSFPALAPYANRAALIAAVEAALAAQDLSNPLKVLIMGALGRCGSGARDFVQSLNRDLQISAWDLPEFTSATKPLAAAVEHDVFINCVYLREAIEPMIDETLLANNQRLKIISDVSCDPSSPDNPIAVYDHITTLNSPFVRARGEGSAVYVQAIDHLPTLLPREASEEYAAALFPYLKDFLLSEEPSSTWSGAKASFDLACEQCLA